MMKKAFFAVLAALAVFALVTTGCDGGGGGSEETLYTVTFDANGGGGTVPDPIKQASEGASIKLPGKGKMTAPAGKPNFVGWATNKDEEEPNVNNTYKPKKDITLYAVWSSEEVATVTFNANGGTGTPPEAMTTTLGGNITLPDKGNLAKAGSTFGGWSKAASGTSPLAAGATFKVEAAAVTLYAVWTGGGPVDPAPGPGPVIEEIKISNGWYNIFEFVLPAGKTVGDYGDLNADYRIADVTTKVRARVFGNYTQKDIDLVRLYKYTKGSDSWNIAVLGSWPGGTSNRWIMNNKYGGAAEVNAEAMFGASAPMDDEWFTAVYPNVFTENIYSGWDNTPDDGSASLPGRKLTAASAGTLYLGVGLTTEGGVTAAMTFSQKNIVLKGKTGTADVVGKPVFFKKGEDLYRAYAGQIDGYAKTPPAPNTASGEPGWRIITGDQYTVFNVTDDYPAFITVTYNVNYPNNDTAPAAPAATQAVPGDSLESAKYGPIAAPTTPPSGVGHVWVFDGWYTVPAATGGFKIDDKFLYYADTTIYARWTDVEGAKITFNGGGATGTKADVYIQKTSGRLSAAQLDPTGLTAPAGKIFGGWYKVDTTASAFDYKNYDNMVKASDGFAVDTTIYAYWYTPVAESTLTFGSYKIEAAGGARIDQEGYMIFADSARNTYMNANNNDTLLTVAWTAVPTGTTLKITYKLLDMIAPTVTSDNKLDAALAWKNGYKSFDGTSAGNYVSWDREDQGTEKIILKPLDTFGRTPTSSPKTNGFSIQINGNTDGEKIRTGYVYGIKIINLEIVP